MKNYFYSPEGRVSRIEYFNSIIFFFIAVSILNIPIHFLGESDFVKVPVVLVFFAICTASVFIQIRRWHDLGKSGVWVCINFIPIIGNLYTLIYLSFFKGNPAENRFGKAEYKNHYFHKCFFLSFLSLFPLGIPLGAIVSAIWSYKIIQKHQARCLWLKVDFYLSIFVIIVGSLYFTSLFFVDYDSLFGIKGVA